MKNSFSSAFIYPYWMKIFGLLIILAGIGIFIYRISKFDILDLTGVSFPLAMGLVFIFFSKEKDFDERIAFLKFKALAVAVPIAAAIVMAINYSQNFQNYSIETDSWFSISAFEYLSITLLIAMGWFYYLKYKE